VSRTARKRFKPEEIVAKPRQVEVLIAEDGGVPIHAVQAAIE